MKEVHLTNASIPGVRCLREMKASTNKNRRDTTYTSKMIVEMALAKYSRPCFFEYLRKKETMIKNKGNRKAIPVRTAEETRHSIASTPEGKLKNHPTQCIPPNTTPTKGIQKIYAISSPSSPVEKKVGTFISPTLKSESYVENMDNHRANRNKPGMKKIKVRRIENVTAIMNGIVIVQHINIKILFRMGRDCQMKVICRRFSAIARDTSVKTFCNKEYTFYN